MVSVKHCDMCGKRVGVSFWNDYESYLMHYEGTYKFVEICSNCQQSLFYWITKGNKN